VAADRTGVPRRPRAPLDEVLTTEELTRRPSRPPDYAAENRALIALARTMAEAPQTILQKLVDLALGLCRADSTGISILEPGGTTGVFRWHAIAGRHAPDMNATVPREASPCGTVLDRDAVLLFDRPERHFVDLVGMHPGICENLLVPFHAGGKPVGTVWALANSSERKFDAEDARLLTSLSRFASVAYQMITTLKAADAGRAELERRVEERTLALSEANAALRQSKERLAAIVRDITDRKQTEQKLHEAEERMRLASKAAGVTAWDIDLVAGTIKYSDDAKQLFGYDRLPEKYFTIPEASELIHPEDRDWVKQAGDRAIKEAGTFSAECRTETAMGRYLWIKIDGTVIRDAQGAPVRFVGIVQNIDDRKRAEEALRMSEERLRRAIEIETVGIIFFKTDGSITDANDAFLRMSGYGREDLAKRVLRWDEMTPREWMPHSLKAIEEFKSMGRTIPYEKEYMRKDGSRWWALFAATRLSKDEGVEFIIDITETKRAEEKLRENEERFRTMADSSPIMIWVTDPAGRMEFVNRIYLDFFGISGDQAAAFDWRQIIHPDDREAYVAAFTTAVRERLPFQARARVKRHDGQWRWLESRGNAIMDSVGRMTGYIGSSPDITDIVESQEALRDADRRKDEFLATLAHELRNPLAPIRNSIHILRLSEDSSPAAERIYETMERQITHMVRLVDDLLEVSRITRGKIELRKERVEFAAVVRSAVETSKPLIEESRHRLTLSIPPEPLTLDADSVRLAQVFANLLNNAAKYTDPGGEIWLTARREDNNVAVSVRDSGVGIPAEMLPRIFDMFTQVDRSAPRAQGGLGIGLTLVRMLVQMHGGSVAAASEGVGKGSEFVVRLPLAVASDSRPRPEQPLSKMLSACRILVVDDNRPAADTLGMLLKLIGAEVHVVYDGPTALRVLENYQPTTVLLDLGMPGMNGYEVAHRIRHHPKLQDVTLIALSGWGQEEDLQRSRSAGFDHHLTKPVGIKDLQLVLV
jgi:PAS domain S-box-containing protein